MTFQLQKIFLTLLFILWSLHSFYSYTYGLPLIATLSGFFVSILSLINGLLREKITFNKIQRNVALFYIFLLFWSIIDLLIMQDSPSPKRIYFIVLSMLYLLGIQYIMNNIGMEILLRSFLLVHGSVLFLQIIVFYGFGYELDFLKMFTGVEQSSSGGSFKIKLLGSFFRPAGLYNEPGTYSNFVAPLLALYARYYSIGLIQKLVFWLSFISIIFTFSTFGLIFIMIILWSLRFKTQFYKIAIFVSIIFTSAPYFIYRFIIRAHSGLNTGTEIREQYISNIFQYISTNLHGFFYGSGNMLSNIYYIDYVMPDNDAGLIVYLVHTNGPVFTVLLMLIGYLALAPLDRYSKCAFLTVLLGKVSLASPFFPVLFYLISYRERQVRFKS